MQYLFTRQSFPDSQLTTLLHVPAKSQAHNEKVPKDAIKNSAREDPEGYSTTLDSTLCNVGLVLYLKEFLSAPDRTR